MHAHDSRDPNVKVKSFPSLYLNHPVASLKAITGTGLLHTHMHKCMHFSRGSAGEYQADERQVSRGSAGEYQADERAGVARLSWRVSYMYFRYNLVICKM